MKLNGLTAEQVKKSREEHGANKLTQIPPDPLFKKILEGFKDPMIMILIFAMIIELIMFVLGVFDVPGFVGKTEWYEPFGIFVAIMLANGVASVSESKQEGKASALKEEEESKEKAKVIRNGKLEEIHVSDVVVGDIVYLQAGDKIPADGIIVEGTLKVDQASLNGETEEATKISYEEGEKYDTKDLLNKYYAYRGTVVCGGEGYMEIKVVGDKTLFGELALEVQEDTRETPLQVKLGKLAKQISTFGYVGAIAIIVGMIAKDIIVDGIPQSVPDWVMMILNAGTIAVTIVVCAVPEGLPMLTSILMSFQSMRMAKDNVLVHKINGIETAGSISLLFSDKTGTITEGKLSVVEISTGNAKIFKDISDMPEKFAADFVTGIGINNSASMGDGKVIGGNSTDRALMSFILDSESEERMNKAEVLSFNPFNSTKKSSSVTVSRDGKSVTYVKGAPEKIIDKCKYYIDENGERKELVEVNYLQSYINTQAGRSMRLLGVAMCDGTNEDTDLTLICVISIRDNVRKEAIDAIKEVQDAGIQVVMVTGDRKETAAAIAREAGLLVRDEDIALTSAELAAMTDEELKKTMPNLRVVSRALPTDKSRLVRVAQELNYVVGMTGDGVNDSPALKKADVGFAMGSGTEVAKEAGDITILDDNFLSIEKAILYGRTMFKSIRKFLIFQLTVNVAAVLTAFIGPFVGYDIVLTVIQLLVINLAMDTLAAIAFGSEPALKEYMKEKPVKRDAGIVTRSMLIQVIVSALYITFICIGILSIQPITELLVEGINLPLPEGDPTRTLLTSAVFATFMMSITFNGFNARTPHINPFEHIARNKNFLIVMGSIFALQFVFVTFGGEPLHVHALTVREWIVCITLAFFIIPLDVFRKLIMGGSKSK